jgi:hypothetical protein
MLCSEYAQSAHELAETDSLDNCKACIEIHTRRYASSCEIEFAGICLYRLSTECNGPEEHICLLSYCEVCHGLLMH